MSSYSVIIFSGTVRKWALIAHLFSNVDTVLGSRDSIPFSVM